MNFKYLGKNVKIYDAKVHFPENISLGDEVTIDDYCFLFGSGGGIEIGNFSHILCRTTLWGGKLTIGNFTSISCGCTVVASSDDYEGEGLIGLRVLDKYRNLEFKDVNIGKHCVVGAGCIILPGVTIGEGCSVGAGSLVNHDLPEWTICYGSPCKPQREKPRDKILRMEKRFLEEYNACSTDTTTTEKCHSIWMHEGLYGD